MKKKNILSALLILLILLCIVLFFVYRKNEAKLDSRYDGIPEIVQTVKEGSGQYNINMQNDIEIIKLPSGATIRMDANRYGASYGNSGRTTQTEEPHLVLGEDYPDNEYYSIAKNNEGIKHNGYSYGFKSIVCNEEPITNSDVVGDTRVTNCTFVLSVSKL